MRIGGSLFLIAVGAILRWAVTDNISNVDLAMVGTILIVVGAIGLVLSLILMFARRRTDVIHEGDAAYIQRQPRRGSARTTYIEPDRRDPYA